MIELSKCPNCAADDRVTIAGKEFCMRCGTPMEDNAKMGVVADTQTNQVANSTLSDPGNTAPVQKFNTNLPETQEADYTQAPAAAQPNTEQAPVDTNSNESQVGEFIEPPRMASATPDDSSNRITIEHTDPALAAASSVAVASAVNALPVQDVQAPVSSAATLGTMTLDRKAPGVLSDDQFDQLNKSVNSASDAAVPVQPTVDSANTADPTSLPPTEDTIKAEQPQPAVTNTMPRSIAMSTDIYSNSSQQQNQSSTEPTTDAHTDTRKTDKKTSHKASKIAKPAAIAVSIAALFATGAYIWKVNYPSLAFKIASAKAGMSATMPGYVPTGYNLGSQIQTNPGTVSYNLISAGSTDKKISVTQTKTDWDSQALAENYVAPKAENYLALQAQGLTIYVLSQNQATWINKGTWYKLESTGQPLNQDQIIKIATSL